MTHATLAEIFPDHTSGYWGTDPGESARNVHVIRNGDLVDGGMVRWNSLPLRGFTEREFRKSQVLEGDLLLTTSGNCGRVAHAQRVPFVTCTSNFVRRLRVNAEVADSRYAFHLMNSERLRSEFTRFTRGTTLQNLAIGPAFESIALPLPSIEEQRRVASILDAADALRTTRRQVIAKLNILTQAIFFEMFGDLGKSAELWPRSPLSEVVSRPPRNGAYFERSRYRSDGSGVRMVHMSDAFNGVVPADHLRRVDASTTEQQKYGLSSNDILVARRSLNFEGSAKPCRVPEGDAPLIYESSLIRVTPNASRLTVGYLFALLSNEVFRAHWVLPLVTGATISGISQSNLVQIPIPIPPLALQLEFDARVKLVEEGQAQSLGSADMLDGLYASLVQRAFRGEL